MWQAHIQKLPGFLAGEDLGLADVAKSLDGAAVVAGVVATAVVVAVAAAGVVVVATFASHMILRELELELELAYVQTGQTRPLPRLLKSASHHWVLVAVRGHIVWPAAATAVAALVGAVEEAAQSLVQMEPLPGKAALILGREDPGSVVEVEANHEPIS